MTMTLKYDPCLEDLSETLPGNVLPFGNNYTVCLLPGEPCKSRFNIILYLYREDNTDMVHSEEKVIPACARGITIDSTYFYNRTCMNLNKKGER